MNVENTNITGHLIVVTGAGGGIGRQITLRLAAMGAIAAACDKDITKIANIQS